LLCDSARGSAFLYAKPEFQADNKPTVVDAEGEDWHEQFYYTGTR
jgi:hypothetical protein